MVAVLLLLMALFVLCAPFLLTVRNADRASAQLADRATARIALEAATRHARAGLGSSHPGIDETPYFDSEEELAVDNAFDEDFLDANDTHGVMWDVDVEDLAGRVDLNSASPQVIANLVDGVARLTTRVLETDTQLSVSSTSGFADAGFVWLGLELVGFGARAPSTLDVLQRGLGVELDGDGVAQPCAPMPAAAHDLGSYVLDQRTFGIPRWRTRAGAEGELALLDAIEQAAETVAFTMAGEYGEDFLPTLQRTTTVHGGVGAGARWMRGSRVVGPVRGKPDWGCVLPLSDSRSFNAGTTVRITDGEVTEFGLVHAVNREGIRLKEALQYEYEPFTAVVQPLAKRPVNINTASPEVLRALFLNLKLRTASARITSREADELVTVVVVSRPFIGLEDFLRRVVLPAAGLEELPPDAPAVPSVFQELKGFGELQEDGTRELVGFMDREDAQALYKNALNANDAELEFSTMPFCFTSRDVYALDLRTSVNARSGIERTHRVREEVELVVPQRDLLAVWARQEDFDEEPRFDREGAGWLSGPEATSRHDRWFGSPWPTRSRAHLGPYDTRPVVDPPPIEDEPPVLTFASRGDLAWLQPAPARTDDEGTRAGHVLHFDDETGDVEGRYLPDGTLEYAPSDPRVRWSGGGGVLQPLSFELWLKPRDLSVGSRFLDVGGLFPESDRLSLLLDDGDLVLRVLDAVGDHPATSFEEFAEVRYSLTEEAGLPVDVWTHVEIGVAGTRPDQLRMLVDGRASPRTPGLTRLAGNLSPDGRTIPVDSTEGFPDRCVLRIGEELIEAVKDGETAFRAVHQSVGLNAGFGGRLARERFGGAPAPNELNLALGAKDTDYPAGTSVQLYGYSLPIQSNVPSSGGQLANDLGPFGVAYVTGIYKDGDFEEDAGMEPIVVQNPQTLDRATIGWGMDTVGGDIEGFELASADADRDIEEVMQAFSKTGGYAALLSREVRNVRVEDQIDPSAGGLVVRDIDGARIGGVEVVRYSTWDGNRLVLSGRGNQVGELKNYGSGTSSPAGSTVGGVASFIFQWNGALNNSFGGIESEVMVVPISVPVQGASGISSFLPASAGDSQFAQITHLGGESHLTEWVRYDEIVREHLVRDAVGGLGDANEAAHGDEDVFYPTIRVRTGTGLAPPRVAGGRAAGPAPSGSAPSAPRRQSGDSYWYYALGEPEVEVEAYPITRAVATHLQHRGTLGTYSHAHPTGTQVLPVWKTLDVDETGGRPGRLDAVALIDQDPTQPVFPATVQHAHRPNEYTFFAYGQPSGVPESEEGTPVTQYDFDTSAIYVALEEALPIPFAASQLRPPITETRTVTRVSMFPSGELPRTVLSVTIGGDVEGSRGAVPSAVVDEVVFGRDSRPNQLVVEERLLEGGESLEVAEVLRTPGGDAFESSPLAGLPRDAGLLRIGDEILAYDYFDAESNVLHFPPGGRGLLGTDAQAHVEGEGIQFLDSWRVSMLAGDMGAEDAVLPVASRAGFPSAGTVLVDEELIHYTHFQSGALAMPVSSKEPGAMDREGVGLFRGRYGTEPTGHASVTPVILFPFRYWDRWSERADAPELHYYEFDLSQPESYWKRVFWEAESPAVGGSELGVLQKTDPDLPWDADPEQEQGLDLLWKGKLEARGNVIGRQSSRAAWRVFVRFEPGAYDADRGLSHGWKATPKLGLFGVEYMGPGRVLRRIDR
jgi:hypothetical protein